MSEVFLGLVLPKTTNSHKLANRSPAGYQVPSETMPPPGTPRSSSSVVGSYCHITTNMEAVNNPELLGHGFPRPGVQPRWALCRQHLTRPSRIPSWGPEPSSNSCVFSLRWSSGDLESEPREERKRQEEVGFRSTASASFHLCCVSTLKAGGVRGPET